MIAVPVPLDPDAPVTLPAPAKVNLFLHINGRRADGYHLLQTAFRMLAWGDSIRIRRRADGAIVRTTDVPGVPAGSDLVVRAARLLQDETGSRFGADIGVGKRIPMGGGLGGGSSDAATVLVALNRLWGCGLTRDALQRLGLALGADVPFFIYGRTAFAEGVGEALAPLDVPPAWYVVVAPDVSVPTAEIFSAKELTRDTPVSIMRAFASDTTRNDMQATVCGRYPEVAEALRWLSQYGDARMSGSGACIFAPFDSKEKAEEVAGKSPDGLAVRVVQGLDEHPMLGWLD